MKKAFTLFFLLACSTFMFAQANFSTSLHATRNGKATYYNAENGGFETITNIPIEDLGCQHCHGATDADGNAYGDNYEPGCVDCHASNSGYSKDALKTDQCYSCHGRQKTVAMVLQLPDVHRDAGMKCWDCHTKEDMHGDGTEYASLFEEGAIDTKCEDCHIDENSTPPFPDHSNYDPHNGNLDCSACHVQSVAACYNCHFESMTESHLKRANRVISGFVFLVNRNGKVHTATFQSATYQGKAFNAFGPNASHTIGKGRTCEDCHNNANVQAYKNSGEIRFATWNEADSTLSWMKGVIPIPSDYETSFKMDFIKYNGNNDDPVVPSKNWSKIGKDTWDLVQMKYCTPLNATQMAMLSTPMTAVGDETSEIPTKFALNQNYPNPFNPTTKITYSVPKESYVTLEVYDALGNLVSTLYKGRKAPGTYSAEFNGNNLSTGIYFASLKSGNFAQTIKMVLLK